MRIVYVSSISFSDVDLSFLMEMQKISDITYILQISQYGLVSCAFDFRGIDIKDGITCAKSIPYLSRYHSIIDLNRFFIFKNPARHGYTYTSFKYNWELYRFIKKGHFDVVHLTFVPSLFNIPFFSLRNKLLLTVHDPIPHSSSVSRMEKYNRLVAFKFFKYYLLLNKAQRVQFIKYYNLDKKTISVFDSRLSSYNYLHIYRQGDNVTRDYILFFGNITAYKGLEYLFDAMVIVHNKYPNLKLVVAGRGDYYFDISHYVKKGCFDIRNYYIADDELATLVSECKFVVIPYIDATQSGVAMTAYAFNKPCLSTNVGGLPEMVIDGQYGIVIPPKDSQAIAEAMLYLLDNPKILERYSQNIKEDYISGAKSWSRIANELLNIYEVILNKNSL